LGDLADVRDGTHDSPKYHPTGYPLVTSKNLTDAGLDMSNVSLISAEDFERINKRSKVDIGNIIFGMIGTIGNPVLVDRCDFAIKNVALIKNSENIQNSLLLQLLKSPIFRKYVQNENVGNTQKFLGLNKIRDYNFLIPASTEQIAIGNFFRALDDTITLHQRKLDGLKELKRGYLQQLFPQTGECVPRVRFVEFVGEWKIREAGEIFVSVSDKNFSYLPVLSASQEKGMVLRSELGIDIKYDISSLNTYKRIQQGQFAIHLRSFQGGFAHSNLEGITSPAYTILGYKNNNEHDSNYWKEVFVSQLFIKRIETITYGIRDGRSISFSEFSTLKFPCPSKAEQTAIGNFFRTFDGQIAVQEQKLSKLRQLKSAYLQKMLV